MASSFVSNILLACAGLASGFILARTLGPDGRGELGSLLALPSVLAGFTLLGMHEAVVYCGINHPERQRNLLTSSLVLSVVAATAVSTVLVVIYAVIGKSLASIVCISMIVLAPLLLVPQQMMQALHRYVAWSVIRSAVLGIWVLIALCTIAIPSIDGATVAVAYVVGQALLAPVVIWTAFKGTRGHFSFSRRDDARALLRYGLPVALIGAPLVLNLRLDLVLVTTRFDHSQIGYYVAAIAWAGLTLPLFSTLSSVAMPIVARRRALMTSRIARAPSWYLLY